MPRQNKGPYLSDRTNSFGFFEVCWTENGRSKRKSTGTGDRRKAQRFYAEFLLAGAGEPIDDAGGITVAQVIDAYLADKTNVAAPSSQNCDFGHLRAFFGAIVLAEIEQGDVDRYIDAREKGLVIYKTPAGKQRGGGKSAPSTTRGELLMLVAAIRHCVKKKKFKSPDGAPLLNAGHIPSFDLPAPPPPRDRWLSREEASALLAACQVYEPLSGDDEHRQTRVYRYAAVMLYTAARRMSVAKLTWDRILLEHDAAKHKAGDYGLINFRAPGEPRTRKRRGWVPIAAELYPILKQAQGERVNEYFLDRPIVPHAPFVRAVKRAKVVGATAHTLRHTWATWAAQDGTSLFDIAGVLHDSLQTVQNTYAHHSPTHLRGAVNRRILDAA
jgi:integrase